MNINTEYLVLPCDDVADSAKKEIERLVAESGDKALYVSPRGRIITLASVADGAKILSEVVTLPNEDAVHRYYSKGGVHGFVPAELWLKAYNAVAEVKSLLTTK